MKYSVLGFNQQVVVSMSVQKEVRGKIIECKLDISDLLILQVIADFMNRPKIQKTIIEDKIYCWVRLSVILEDLPILNIKQQAFSDKLDKLVLFGLLERKTIRNQSGSYSYFRIGENYEKIKYSDSKSSEVHLRKCSETQERKSSEVHDKDYNNNSDYTTTDKKEDTKVSKKNEIDYDSIFNAWNEMANNVEHINGIRSISDKRKKMVESLIKNCSTNSEEIVKLINTIPYADDWVIGKGSRGWAIDFDYLMKNTSNWYVKALEGDMHKKNRSEFDKIMNGEYISLQSTSNNSVKFQF